MNKDKKPLSETHPELAKEAHGWDPKICSKGSHKKVKWKCKKDHIWEASPNNRVFSNRNCPVCSNRIVKIGFNDLATTHPEIAREANGWDPKTVVAGSGMKIEWRCQRGHFWKASAYNRSTHKTGCPVCKNKLVQIGFNDLATTHPEIAREANGWDPKTVVAGSGKKVEWRCKKGHVWENAISKRTLGSQCPVCINRIIQTGFNDIATTHPDTAREANGWSPERVGAGYGKKLSWKCREGHIWNASPESRTQKLTGCPFCTNRTIEIGFNDLATTHPEIAREANGWDPKTVVAGSHKILEWQCREGHIWNASPENRALKESGCPVCKNKLVQIGFNDLATTHPEIAREANGWDPKTVVAGSQKMREWKCMAGHLWKSKVYSRVNGSGCHICQNRTLQIGFNDLATTHPEIAREANGWDPKKYFAGNNRDLLNWKCHLGHEWVTSCNARTNREKDSKCPVCSNRTIGTGFNDLATTHPDLAREASGWDPTEYFSGTAKKLSWKCLEGHIWKASPNSRTNPNLESGCPSCAKSGFDPNQNGYVYFLIQPQWEIYQIGITNVPENRLGRHKRNGFDLLELRGPMDGHTAREIESSLLRYLKSQKADLSPEHVVGKFDGYSESWTIDSFQINSLKELIDKASEAGY